MFNTPILLIIFKRKDTALKVLDTIRKVKPKKLYIAADGWRSEEEKIKCIDTREAVLKAVDWDCDVKTLFQDKNLGCCNGVATAITWFFDNEEQGIILEDDIIAENSFFYYCEKLLNYYKDNEKIMHITGDSPLDRKVGNASYYFATVQHCWGWASWRRAWKYYDSTMNTISYKDTKNTLKKRYKDFNIKDYWQRWFYRTADINTWDYQWTYCIMSKGGICINPSLNLTSNIGFGADSTHTGDPEDENANRKTYPIDIENIIHPKEIKCDSQADFEIAIKRFNIKPFSLNHNITREIKRIINQIRGIFIKK
ncbi:nucleotide-diphospho-sugar transferase [Brachyspira alvinipulli]|uniref:nucleotide-diphospho-sugar transferase n=1 Tax=Brachyspira alvinipulli TaxID=84379 RepID=UPI00300632A8